MFSSQNVSIYQGKNGWMVMLPYVTPAAPDFEELTRLQARIAKQEFDKDETLEQLTMQSEIEDFKKIPIRKDRLNIKMENVYVFKTWPEVQEFLDKKLSTL